MSFDYRFEIPNITDDGTEIDTTDCTNCPYRHNACWNAGRCLLEEIEC